MGHGSGWERYRDRFWEGRTETAADEGEEERGVARHLRRDLELYSGLARCSMVSIDRGDHTKEGNGGGEDDHVNARDGSIAGQYTRRPGFRLAGYVWTYPDLMKQLARRSRKEAMAEEERYLPRRGDEEGDAADEHGGRHHEVDDTAGGRRLALFTPLLWPDALSRARGDRLTRCRRTPF